MANIKVGDLIRVVRKVESERGWFNSWTKTMDAALKNKSAFTVDSIGSSGVYFTGDQEFCGLGFPPSSLEVVEKENFKTHGFKVGDRVIVAQKVTEQPGWDNNWNSDMDEFIGHEFTIREITCHGIRFEQNNKFKPQLGYGFPSDSLKLVASKCVVKQPKSKKSYQYLRFPENHFFKDLCLTISTEVAELPGGKHKVEWAVSFKHPKDKFDRSIAREMVDTKEPKQIILDRKFTRNEIVLKILCDITYNDVFLSDKYKDFVSSLLTDFSFGVYRGNK